MAGTIRFLLENLPLTLLAVGLIASCLALLRAPKPLTRPVVVEALFSYFLLFSIGVGLFYNFVIHRFFGKMAAGFNGWADSPFQAEVGFASLGFAVVGFLAFRRSFDLRLAAVTGPALFLIAAGIGHIYQIITAHNFAPGNSGLILYTDFLLPIIAFVLLWLQHQCERKTRS